MQGRAGRKPQCRRSEVSALRPKPARGAWAAPVLLQKQEQIKGPENASIARFDGLGCYQSRSEIGNGFRMQAAWAGTGVGRKAQTGQMACWLPGEAFATAHERFKAAPNSRCAAAVKVQGRFAGWFRAHEAFFCCKSRQKKAPENASIARFQGLGCYPIRSGAGRGFQGLAAGPVCMPLKKPEAAGSMTRTSPCWPTLARQASRLRQNWANCGSLPKASA